MCEQPFEPGQDNSVGAAPLAPAFLMGVSSQMEHQEESLRDGDTALVLPRGNSVLCLAAPRAEREGFAWENKRVLPFFPWENVVVCSQIRRAVDAQLPALLLRAP